MLKLCFFVFFAFLNQCFADHYKIEQVMRGEGQRLIGGEVADPAEWPASPFANNCSSTIVGPRVQLIAAHCVSNGGTKTFTIGTTRYSAKCSHHPSYRNNSTADWALCLVDKEVAGIPYENVATEAQYKVGMKLLLTGYGCRTAGGGGGMDGKFRIGMATVSRIPGTSSNYDTVTNNGAALCYGDSGGGVYFINEAGERWVVAVNSRGDIARVSYLSTVWVKVAQDWMKQWSEANKAPICGIEKLPACRNFIPPVPSEFDVDAEKLTVRGKMKKGFETELDLFKEKVEACLK